MSKVLVGILVFILGIITGLTVDTTKILSALRLPSLTATPTPAGQSPLGGATPTLDPTANWKTYMSGMYEIKYPPNAGVGDAPTSDYITISYGDPKQEPGTDCRNGGCDNLPPPLLTITIGSRFSNQNFDSVVTSERQKALSIDNQSEITSLFIAGIPAKFFEGAGNGYYQNYIIEHTTLHNYFLVISVGYRSQQDVAGTKQLADQILSTFKFVDTGNTPSAGVGCQYKGQTYKDGETFRDICNTCGCESGEVMCSLIACQ